MARICSVRGCGEVASGFGRLCQAHKSRARRHGDPRQHGVTKAHLKPYIELVEARISKNPASKAWASADARWQGLVKYAHGVLARHRTLPGVRFEKTAAEEVIKLAKHVEPRAVVLTAAALYVMQELDPGSFKSDTAFRCQLVRRVRGLTHANAKAWRSSGTVKTAYSELPPRTAEVLGAWLAEALGVVGVHLSKLELADRKREDDERRHFYEALEDLS